MADSRQGMVDIGELAGMLACKIDQLVPAILPAAVREGHEFVVGSIYGERGRSMAIRRNGLNQGVWCDFSSDNLKGDALDLVAHVTCGGDKKKAVSWARSWLGLDGMDPARVAVKRKEAQQMADKKERESVDAAEKKRKLAHRVWLEGREVVAGDPVYLYLLGRGIDLNKLAKFPGAIRFSPECLCYDGDKKIISPAMVTAIVGGNGRHVATHRTFLRDAGGRSFVKNDRKSGGVLSDAKKVLGSYAGGYIPLTRGASGKPLKAAPADDDVMICEGIEDGLTLALAFPEARVIAAVSVTNFAAVPLPLGLKAVTIIRDNDKPGSPADNAVSRAANIYSDRGMDVYMWASDRGKDFNDWLRGGQEGAA